MLQPIARLEGVGRDLTGSLIIAQPGMPEPGHFEIGFRLALVQASACCLPVKRLTFIGRQPRRYSNLRADSTSGTGRCPRQSADPPLARAYTLLEVRCRRKLRSVRRNVSIP